MKTVYFMAQGIFTGLSIPWVGSMALFRKVKNATIQPEA
jgi:hypothetical protein